MPVVAHGWFSDIFYFFLRLGPGGVFILSTLDSNILFLPFAIDLLVILLASLHHDRFVLYAASATAGSILGSWLLYWPARRGGDRFLRAHLSPQHYRRMHERVARKGPFLLALPGLIPPPFPFTPWVLATGALGVPQRPYFLSLTAVRFLRFFVEALIAIRFGRIVIAWMNTVLFVRLIDALVWLAIGGSALSIYRLVRSTRDLRGKNGSASARPAA